MTGRYMLRQDDAVEFLQGIEDESIDLILTDPAYESLEKHRAKGTTTRLKVSDSSSNEWFQIFPNTRFPELFAEAFRVLKPDRHMYVMCDAETMFAIKPMGEAAGFTFWKPIIWDKMKIGMGYHYRARCERILFFEKGKRRLNDLGVPDVLQFERVRNGYPTEKPVELLELLIRQSTEFGNVVADPFSGSASTGEAALKQGRHFAGCDAKESAVEAGLSRLSSHGEAGLQLPTRLPTRQQGVLL